MKPRAAAVGGTGGSNRLPVPHTVVVDHVTRIFDDLKVALDDVSLTVPSGHVHALLGRNGAGKTTLLRIVCGLAEPTVGSVGIETPHGLVKGGFEARHLTGIVSSGGRSFYLRLSGRENLAFFGRLHGLSRARSVLRADELLEVVGLENAARRPVGGYSQGMRRRLSVARALILDPPILLMDEATHDLDPDGARLVRDLTRRAAHMGAAVIWATQRLEEIRGFADGVTVIEEGAVRFSGSVQALVDRTPSKRYVVRVRPIEGSPEESCRRLAEAVDPHASVTLLADGAPEYLLVNLREQGSLSEVMRALTSCVELLAWREESPDVERAFLELTGAPR